MRRLAIVSIVALCVGLLFVAYLGLRGNAAQVDPALELESWDIVSDGEHNSNTDLIHWRGAFHLVHAASPFHMGTARSRLVIRRSPDATADSWEKIAELRVPGKDVRDPKFAVIGGRLLLYALTNEEFYAVPSQTVVAISEEGERWSEFEAVGPRGWLFWRPKARQERIDGRDTETWYVPAYWREHGKSILLRSGDGFIWQPVSTIYEGEGNDETAIEFLPDGRLLATARLEVTPDSLTGDEDAATLLAVAEPPYEAWSYTKSRVTRLDGPVLFSDRERVFAVARYQPGPQGRWTRLGSMFSRKRTAFYHVTPERLVWLSDLPSAGDTSYAGAVLRDGHVYVDYYTSHTGRDYPWVLGMLLATDIRMARAPLSALHTLAEAGR